MIEHRMAIRAEVLRDPVICTITVQKVLGSAPRHLRWLLQSRNTLGYSATTTSLNGGHQTYSVNLLSGVVLLNGHPPGLLPRTITEHPVFVRVFGATSFETVVSSAGVFRTTQAVDQCFYEFSLTEAHLNATEITPDGRYLQLVDVSSLGRDLPPRLRELHSHWRLRATPVIGMRGIQFRSKQYSFVLRVDVGECLAVPDHMRSQDLPTLASSSTQILQRLVNHQSEFINIISKFESPSYIHKFTSGDASTLNRIELPRYGLTFESHDTMWYSIEHSGYRLAETQQLHDTLIEFESYLVLERFLDDITLPKIKVLLPEGLVEPGQPVSIKRSDACGAVLEALCFTLHPRLGCLEGSTSRSRLQLAALYIGTSSQLPEQSTGRTGCEHAMSLIRRCWSTKPLSVHERAKLACVAKLGQALPSLVLLCKEIEWSSQGLNFLHDELELNSVASPIRDELVNCYQVYAKQSANHHRLLRADEERRLFGFCLPRAHSFVVDIDESDTCDLDEIPLETDVIEEHERRLQNLLTKVATQKSSDPFPFSTDDFGSVLGSEMINALRESWDIDQAGLTNHLVLLPGTDIALQHSKDHATRTRESIWSWLLNALNIFPQTGGIARRACAFRIRRACATLPCANIADCLRFATEKSEMKLFNPFLSEAALAQLHGGVLLFLKACVLEDKCDRLLQFSRSQRPELLVQELQTVRVWNEMEHPEWLVYEATSGLQIRPAQFEVAQKLIEEPGAIVQLNMGGGKTRVIVPMLILHWGSQAEQRVVRVHALSTLIDEV